MFRLVAAWSLWTTLLLLLLLLLSRVVESTGSHQLVCNEEGIPAELTSPGNDPRLASFDSLNSLCATYPAGFGLHCTEHGAIQYRRFLGELFFTGYNNLPAARYCVEHCNCHMVQAAASSVASNAGGQTIGNNVADTQDDASSGDPASSSTGQAFDTGSDQSAPDSEMQDLDETSTADDTVDDMHFTDSDSGDEQKFSVMCLPMYGNPNLADCDAALDKFWAEPPNSNQGDQLYEFSTSTSEVSSHSSVANFETPRYFTSGACVVAITPASIPGSSRLLRRYEAAEPLSHINEFCVGERGQGGEASLTFTDEHGREGLIDFEAPNFVVFATGSRYDEEIRQSMYARILGLEPNSLLLKNIPLAAANGQEMQLGQQQPAETLGSQTGPPALRACLDNDMCDSHNNEVCAQPFNAKLSTDSHLWSGFTCLKILNVAAAISTGLTYRSCSTGRCLLEADGSVQVNDAFSVSAVSHTSGSFQEALSLNGTTYTPSTAIFTGSFPVAVNKTALQITSHKAPNTNSSLLLHITAHYSAHKALAGPLICPCNCTYFSFGCCFTPLVSEVTFSVQSGYAPPLPGYACDFRSGQWTDSTANKPTLKSLSPGAATAAAAAAAAVETEVGIVAVESDVPIRAQHVSTRPTFSLPTPNAVAAQPLPAQSHAVCSSSGNWCASFWGCGDAQHCYCRRDSVSALFFKCFPKAGYGPNVALPASSNSSSVENRNGERKRHRQRKTRRAEQQHYLYREDSSPPPRSSSMEATDLGQEVCPCNCTYTSTSCCSAPDGIVHANDAAEVGAGPVQLPVDLCCDLGTGNVRPRTAGRGSGSLC